MASMRVTLVRSMKQNMSNRAYVNPESLELYREIRQNQRARCGAVGSEHGCALINDILAVQLQADGALRQNEIALNERQLKSAKTWMGRVVTVAKFELPNNIEMEALYVELQMPSGTPNRINARNFEEYLKKRFSGQIMHVGQEVQFIYNGVTGIYIVNRVIMGGNEDVSNGGIRGMLMGKTKIFFDPLTENPKIVNQAMVPGRIFRRDINPEEAECVLKAHGIGGMSRTLNDLYTKVFVTRTMDPRLVARLGITHEKGILLYGPPGTGKTLFMSVLSKVLYAREPKVVNGPELISKWIGESEKNIRELFNDADEDYRKYGEDSPLHMIIFDEIDSIAQRRESVHSENGSDRVVSQLLTMIDGVKIRNNILIVGTTNRKDLIDEALLRPGRLGIHIEVGVPDYEGRLNILEVHTEKMKQCDILQSDVDLQQIASMTEGWSGTELGSIAKHALAKALTGIKLGHANEMQIRVNNEDFIYGIKAVRLAQ